MNRDAQFYGDVRHVPFVAAAGLAHDEKRPKSGFGIPLQLTGQQFADDLWLILKILALVTRQDVHCQSFFADIEGDDMLEGSRRVIHSHGCRFRNPGLHTAV